MRCSAVDNLNTTVQFNDKLIVGTWTSDVWKYVHDNNNNDYRMPGADTTKVALKVMERNAWREKLWGDLGKQTQKAWTCHVGADCSKYGQQQQGRPDRRWRTGVYDGRWTLSEKANRSFSHSLALIVKLWQCLTGSEHRTPEIQSQQLTAGGSELWSSYSSVYRLKYTRLCLSVTETLGVDR